jgi:uncharacterized repeat protein (TIGR03803 family)
MIWLTRYTAVFCFLALALKSEAASRYFTTIKTFGFPEQSCSIPAGNLCLASDGRFYAFDGASSLKLFSINPDGSDYRIHREFGIPSPDLHVETGVTEGSDGRFYGRATNGLFSINKDGSDFKIQVPYFAFNASSKLLKGGDGQLYCLNGSLLRLKKDGSGFDVLVSNEKIGVAVGDLLELDDSTFIGAAYPAAGSQYGSVYRVNHDRSDFQVLRSFKPAPNEPASPSSGLVRIGDTIYGVSDFGREFYSLKIEGGETKILHRLPSDNLMMRCTSELVVGPNFKLYGIVESYLRKAAICELDPVTGAYKETPLNAGDPAAQIGSSSGLTLGSDGALYGLAGGDPRYTGFFYKFHPNATPPLQVQRTFSWAGGDGVSADYVLVSKDGLLYGVSAQGGSVNGGVFWKVAPDGVNYTILHSFGEELNGFRPFTLIEGNDDWFYGVAKRGYEMYPSDGAIFRISRNGETVQVLHTHQLETPAGVVQKSDGRLYVTVSCKERPTADCAYVYSMNADGSDYQLVHMFGVQEVTTLGELLLGSDGNFYGAALCSFPPAARLFKLSTTGVKQILREASPPQGVWQPTLRAMIESTDGALYGINQADGVFKINKDGTGFRSICSLPYPQTNTRLAEDDDGFLYGVTQTALFRTRKRPGQAEILRDDDWQPAFGILLGPQGALFGVNDFGYRSIFRLGESAGAPTVALDLPSAGGIDVKVAGPLGSRVQVEVSNSLTQPEWNALPPLRIEPGHDVLRRQNNAGEFFRARLLEN